ncbi:hypothetical protein IJ182_09435 [bacterium]|nr:hypothetical protein [bacterium]
MNYILIENDELVSVCDYIPNIGNDNITVIPYSGNIPQERILYINGRIEDSKNYIYVNGKYIRKTNNIENTVNTNSEARKYLNNTDWLVIRHRDQIELNIETSLTQEEYIDLLEKRQQARERVNDYGE